MLLIISAAFLSYLAGSFPTAYIAGKILKKTDIRKFGSGNPGATNAIRLLGIRWGSAVLAADFLKGFIPVIIVCLNSRFFHAGILPVMILTGIASISGHIFPPWLQFRGGKGVACSAGVLTALFPLLFPVSIIIFVTAAWITKKMSAASIITAISVPVTYHTSTLFSDTEPDLYLSLFTLIIPAVIIFKHRGNIKRILQGMEPDIKFTKGEK